MQDRKQRFAAQVRNENQQVLGASNGAPAQARRGDRQVGELPASVEAALKDSLNDLRFGQVIITVQDGLVIQIDRTDRLRATPS